MTSPQLENGYTMISNEILEKVYQSDFNATQLDIILLLLRYTYGFHRETVSLSVTFISNGIGKERNFTAKQIRNLQKMNVIKSITTQKGITKELKFNNNFDEWTIVQKDYSPKELWSNKTVNYSLFRPSTVVFLDPQENKYNKENKNNKENIIKESRHKYGEYKNVLLSDIELEKLKNEFPNDWEARIETLSGYIASTGKTYKNHLATIRVWARKEKTTSENKRYGGTYL